MRPVMPPLNRRWQIVPRHDVGATPLLHPMIAPIAAGFGFSAPAFARHLCTCACPDPKLVAKRPGVLPTTAFA